jgi:CRP-like cAMP-binding protein
MAAAGPTTITSSGSARAGDSDAGIAHGRRVHLFFGLSQDEIRRITSRARILRKTRGEFIYIPGESADFVYVLRRGRVKLSVLSESGKEVAIDIIGPGEIFGEFALVDEAARSNMTRALDEVTMWAFDKHDFAQLLIQAELSMNYIRLVGDRRRRMEKKLSDMMSKDVSARVCELLREISADSSEVDGGAREPLLPLTHYDIACLIGASRQTTTSVLNKLERRGIIELGRGWIRVKRRAMLQSCASLMPVAALQFFFCLCQLADILSTNSLS